MCQHREQKMVNHCLHHTDNQTRPLENEIYDCKGGANNSERYSSKSRVSCGRLLPPLS
jgi:hypothetical protein